MSMSDLQQTKNEKLYELGFLYYNKAVDGMNMMPEALEVINDIRARFGYLLYLKQTGADETQISELDVQIASQFSNLGSLCYGYFENNISLDDELVQVCKLIFSIDEQLKHENEIADEISVSAADMQSDASLTVEEQVPEIQNEAKELTDDDFVMPNPQVSSVVEKELQQNISIDDVESVEVEQIELKLAMKCSCGTENEPGSKFCGFCGKKLV